MTKHVQGLLDSMKALVSSGDYSDLTLTCKGDTYRVHKNVVCTRAEFFKAAIRFSAGKEAEDATINLPNDEPHIVKLLLQYIYTADYDPVLRVDAHELPKTETKWPIERTRPLRKSKTVSYTYDFPHKCGGSGTCNQSLCPHHICSHPKFKCRNTCKTFICRKCHPKCPAGHANQILVHAKMYVIADKYMVTGLRSLAREKFARACKRFFDSPDFTEAAAYVYANTRVEDPRLRDLVVHLVASHMDMADKEEWQVMLKTCDGLAMAAVVKRARMDHEKH